MNMSNLTLSDRLAGRPCEQGVRLSAVNQAEVKKLATGSRQSKRSRTSSDDANPSTNYEDISTPWPKFLVITGCDDGFSRLSAITICRTLKETIGFVEIQDD